MNSIVELPYPTKLTWNLSTDLEDSIIDAANQMDRLKLVFILILRNLRWLWYILHSACFLFRLLAFGCIPSATVIFYRAISNLDFYLLRFEKFGKEFPKSQNMSPDCFIQLALQLTYYK